MPQAQTAFDIAEEAVRRGFVPIPLRSGTDGKMPSEKAFWEPRPVTKERFANSPNVGVLLGQQGGHICDVDLDSQEAIEIAPYYLPLTEMISGRASKPRSHYWYKIKSTTADQVSYHKWSDPEIQGDTACLVEFRWGDKRHTVWPGSIHVSGESYTWDVNSQLAEVEGSELYKAAATVAAAALVLRVYRRLPGNRQDLIMHLTGGLVRIQWDIERVLKLIRIIDELGGDSDLERREQAVRNTFKAYQTHSATTGWKSLAEIIGEKSARNLKAWLSSQGSSPTLHPTPGFEGEDPNDTGLATRFIKLFGQDYKYFEVGRQWNYYNGIAWIDDRETGHIFDAIAETVKSIKTELSRASSLSDEEWDVRAKWYMASGTAYRRKAALQIASETPSMRVTRAELDTYKRYFNVQNGTLCLYSSGGHELNEHDRSHLLTRISPVVYIPSATCPNIDDFLQKAIPDPEIRAYMLRVLGYCITAETSEQCFFILRGPGSNGKTSFQNLVADLLGDEADGGYTARSPIQLFLRTPTSATGETASPMLAALAKCRVVLTEEPPAGQRFAESFVKAITGEGYLSARKLYGDPFTFRPEFKLFIAENYETHASGDDSAFWRRVQVIRFDEPLGKTLEDRRKDWQSLYRQEMSGFLNRVLEGYQDWCTQGLNPPPQVTEAVEEYRKRNDPISQLFEKQLYENPSDPNLHETVAHAYEVYQTLSEVENTKPFSYETFRQMFLRHQKIRTAPKQEHKWNPIKKNSNDTWYMGFRLSDTVTI